MTKQITTTVFLKNQSISRKKCMVIGLMWTQYLDVVEVQTEEEIYNLIMDPQTIEQANTDDEK